MLGFGFIPYRHFDRKFQYLASKKQLYYFYYKNNICPANFEDE